ncbi:MAG: hypothetical protein PVS2B2_22330 [Candidatus Acidiferrum sp.]
MGLPGTISGKQYEATAEALEPIQANFIPREPFLNFLHKHGEAALRIAEILSDICHTKYHEVRNLGLSTSAAEKLARFLLNLPPEEPKSGQLRAKLTLTHEEIAETIGTSRETVTRVFANFKRQQLVDVRGSTLIINKSGLQDVLQG